MRGELAAVGSAHAAGHQNNFQWSLCDSFVANMPVFAGKPVEISVFPEVQHDSNYFLVHLCNDTLDQIVNETNRYYTSSSLIKNLI